MLKNYFTIAFRHFRAHWVYVVGNVLGLGAAIAISIVAYQHYAYNAEFNEPFLEDKSIYVPVYQIENQGRKHWETAFKIALADRLNSDFPGLKINRTMYGMEICKVKKQTIKESIWYVDSTFFDFFKPKLKYGNYEGLKSKNAMYLSETMSKKYFGEQNPVGQTFTVMHLDTAYYFVVAGVFDKQKMNTSHSIYNILMRIENHINWAKIDTKSFNSWQAAEVVLKVNDKYSPEQIKPKLKQYAEEIDKPSGTKSILDTDLISYYQFSTTDTQELYRSNGIGNSFVNFTLIIAGLVLLLACFNYTNTSIALATNRLKETGMRKVLGSNRIHLIIQFLLEHFFISLLALLVGLLFSEWLMYSYWQIWNTEGSSFLLMYTYQDMDLQNLSIALAGVVVLTTVLSGLYPAFYISSLKPSALLGKNLKLRSGNGVTYVLLILQFMVTIFGFTRALYTIDALNKIEASDKGYNSQNIYFIENLNSDKDYNKLYNALQTNPKIVGMAGTSHHIGWYSWTEKIKVGDKELECKRTNIGAGYYELMGVKLLKGRFFNRDFTSDVEESILVNEKLVEKAGLINPLEEYIEVYGKKRKIIGVIGNYRTTSPTEDFMPLVVLFNNKSEVNVMAIKINTTDFENFTNEIKAAWVELFPNKPFHGYFQNEYILYDIKRNFNNHKKIILFISFISLLLAIMGVLVLVTLLFNKKTKEIGIRKILGANAYQLAWIVAKPFAWILVIASVFGSIIGYILAKYDQNNLVDFRPEINLSIFFFASAIVILTVFLTIGAKIWQATRVNPVQNLRAE